MHLRPRADFEIGKDSGAAGISMGSESRDSMFAESTILESKISGKGIASVLNMY